MISQGSENGGQDFELNLASIIDCLTVIIAFLLLSSSFVSYGSLDTAVAAPQKGEKAAAGENPSSITLTVRLLDESKAEVEVAGSRSERRTIDRSTLSTELQSIKSRHAGLSGMVLTASSRVSYGELIRAMDDSRRVFAAVAIGTGGGSR